MWLNILRKPDRANYTKHFSSPAERQTRNLAEAAKSRKFEPKSASIKSPGKFKTVLSHALASNTYTERVVRFNLRGKERPLINFRGQNQVREFSVKALVLCESFRGKLSFVVYT